MSLAYLVADVGGGDVHHGHIDKGDIGVVDVFAVGVAGTGIYIDLIMLEDVLPVAPTVEGGEVVGTHNEAELLVSILLAEMGEGEDCIGWDREMELDIACAQMVVVVYGTANHLEPLLVGEEGASLLKGVLGGDYKPHFVERGMCQHGTADDKVAHMYGIERAEEKSYVSHGRKGLG